jgi:hypothetical protein
MLGTRLWVGCKEGDQHQRLFMINDKG